MKITPPPPIQNRDDFLESTSHSRCPDTTPHGHPVASSTRHPEFISGSQIRQRVQYDAHGRSMTEMLGVLAIVGVLSIAALVGLKYAFMKHQSNLIIEDVKLAGFIVKDELFETLPLTEEKSLSGYFTPQTSYPFTTFKETDTSYAVVIDGVAENLCLDLKKRKVEWLEEIRANGQENTCRANNSNSMSFFFNTDLSDLKPDCRYDSDCPTTTPYCRQSTCQPCPEDEFLSKGGCQSCNSLSAYTSTQADCAVCSGSSARFWAYSSQNCYPCSSASSYSDYRYITQDSCARCSNRFYIKPDGRCIPCDGTVSLDGLTCLWKNQCEEGFFATTSGCVPCNDSGSYATDINECQKCQGANQRFYSGFGFCTACNSTTSNTPYMWGGQENASCNLCPQRYFATGAWCFLCPEDVTELTTETACQKCGGSWASNMCQAP